jgi:hypothetical protein
MLLLRLRRPQRDAVTCAFDNIREPTTGKKRRREQRSVCESKKLVKAKTRLTN